MSDQERPKKKRGRTLGVRVDEDIYRGAQERAEHEGRSLVEILRSWLFGWSSGEYPSPPKAPGEGRRAPKRPRGED